MLKDKINKIEKISYEFDKKIVDGMIFLVDIRITPSESNFKTIYNICIEIIETFYKRYKANSAINFGNYKIDEILEKFKNIEKNLESIHNKDYDNKLFEQIIELFHQIIDCKFALDMLIIKCNEYGFNFI